MKYEPEVDDAILGALMRRGQDLSAGVETEPAEDLFELFIEGKLSDADQEEFSRYLDANPSARRAASLYLEALETLGEESAPESPPTLRLADVSTTRRPWTAWSPATYAVALAACVMIAVGVGVMQRGGGADAAIVAKLNRSAELISAGSFAEAERLLSEVDVESPRRQLLAARAAMREPDDLASSAPWSLLAYGYEVGDAVAMDGAPSAEEMERLGAAKRLVERVDGSDADARLARAWIAMKLNDHEAAAEALDPILHAAPDSPAAILARGVAHFMAGEYDQAAARFERHLELRPGSFAGRINLAKCLVETGNYGAAMEQLETIDASEAPSDEVRRQLAEEIDRLRPLAQGKE